MNNNFEPLRKRTIIQHPVSKLYMFVEYCVLPNTSTSSYVVLGGEEFDDCNDCFEYSRGFEDDRYTWTNPDIIAATRIKKR